MIKRIIEIKNVGTFTDFSAGKGLWNGDCGKTQLIYAPNGSGKTTLSTIFRSLASNNSDLIRHKQSINKKDLPYIKILIEGYGLVEFKNWQWTKNLSEIEIFDIHFIEDFLFQSSVSNEKNTENLLQLLLGSQGNALRNRFKRLNSKLHRVSIELKKSKKGENKNAIKTHSNNLEVLKSKIENTLIEFDTIATPIFKEYVEKTNEVLQKFTTSLKLVGFINPSPFFELEKITPSLYLEIKGKVLRFKQPELTKKIGSAKFALSEGDKNAIALSFFLARLEVLGVKNKIVIIDDPLSSFDYQRKTSTVTLLSRIASASNQFFLLSHDIHFVKAVSNKLEFANPLNLTISNSNSSSIIATHDIAFETSSGYRKDLKIIKEFSNLTSPTESDKREIVRCIRPVLETLLKTKYFEYLDEKDWLGDIIGKIRKSGNRDPLFKLNQILIDLINLNDYSKSFHHSELSSEMIDLQELKVNIEMLKRTILLI